MSNRKFSSSFESLKISRLWHLHFLVVTIKTTASWRNSFGENTYLWGKRVDLFRLRRSLCPGSQDSIRLLLKKWYPLCRRPGGTEGREVEVAVSETVPVGFVDPESTGTGSVTIADVDWNRGHCLSFFLKEIPVAAKPTSSSPATYQDGMSQVSRNNTSTCVVWINYSCLLSLTRGPSSKELLISRFLCLTFPSFFLWETGQWNSQISQQSSYTQLHDPSAHTTALASSTSSAADEA